MEWFIDEHEHKSGRPLGLKYNYIEKIDKQIIHIIYKIQSVYIYIIRILKKEKYIIHNIESIF